MADKNMNAKINVDFEESASRQSLNSGDSLPTLFGKIKKFFSDLKTVCFSGSYNDLSDTPTTATTDTDGLMSAEDKTKLDNADDTYALKSLYGDTTINVGRKSGTDIGEYSVVIGHNSSATKQGAIAEGMDNTASGYYSHAEGMVTTASGYCSHSEGMQSTADGEYSHAGGKHSKADGCASFAHGWYVNAFSSTDKNAGHAAFGMYNLATTSTLFSIGDGTADNARHNAFEITATGGKLHDKDIATLDDIPTELPASNVTDIYSATGTEPVNGKAVASAISTKVDKISGKSLSTNDLTNTLKNNYDAAYTHSQSAHAPSSAQANVIETIKVNNTALTPTNKTVNISVPSNTDRYVNKAVFADDSTATAANPIKMTLTRAGSDTNTITANIPKVSSSSAGVVPKGAAVSSQSKTTKFLREDGTWAAPSYTTNTDTKVTSAANHYTPAKSTTKAARGGTLTDITNSTSGTQVVTGVEMDAKGHVTGVTSIALKSTDTKVTVDSAMSDTSTNPVQNKVIKQAIDNKADSSHIHVKADITDFPASLPANGGDAATVNGYTVNANVPALGYYYATCDSSLTTNIKTVTCEGFEFKEGARITVRFTANNGDSPPSSSVFVLKINEDAGRRIAYNDWYGEGILTEIDSKKSEAFCSNQVWDFIFINGRFIMQAPLRGYQMDDTLSNLSSNPVENKVIKAELDKKANIDDIPTSLPANGGNADTIDGMHAGDFPLKSSQVQFVPYNMLYYALNDKICLFSNNDDATRGIYFINNSSSSIIVCVLVSATAAGPVCQYGYGANTYPEIQNTGENREWFTVESIPTSPVIYAMEVPPGKLGYFGFYFNSASAYTTVYDIRCPYFNFF